MRTNHGTGNLAPQEAKLVGLIQPIDAVSVALET